MVDTYYPLPHEKLKERYAPLFAAVKGRISGSFIGLPASAKSGYLKFILQNKQLFENLFSKLPRSTRMVYFEPMPFIDGSPYHWLFQLSTTLEQNDDLYSHPDTDDPVVIYTEIQKYLLNLSKEGGHLCLVIGSYPIWKSVPVISGRLLSGFYNTARKTPSNACSMIFLVESRNPICDAMPKFYDSVPYPLKESAMFFPVLDEEETLYTFDRFCEIWDVAADKRVRSKIYEYTGGYYSMTVDIVQIAKASHKRLTPAFFKNSVGNHRIIRENLDGLWKSLSAKQKQELTSFVGKSKVKPRQAQSTLQHLGVIDDDGSIQGRWLQRYLEEGQYKKLAISKSKSVESYLQGSELQVFKLLKERAGDMVTRDEIAEILWGKDVAEKYSDWAIDKCISRVRKKLRENDAKFMIITLRGKGYGISR